MHVGAPEVENPGNALFSAEPQTPLVQDMHTPCTSHVPARDKPAPGISSGLMRMRQGANSRCRSSRGGQNAERQWNTDFRADPAVGSLVLRGLFGEWMLPEVSWESGTPNLC